MKANKWECVNLGCMMVCMSDALDGMYRLLNDNEELSKPYFSEEEVQSMKDVMKLIARKRDLLKDDIRQIFVENHMYEEEEDSKEEESQQNAEEEEREDYIIEEDVDKEGIETIIVGIRRKQ